MGLERKIGRAMGLGSRTGKELGGGAGTITLN